jgi:IclR family acetate operon transcriptional repressor
MSSANAGEIPVGTLERGLAILRAFKTSHEIAVQDLADHLQLSRSTTYRLVERLKELGFLEVSAMSGRLRLGIEAMQIGVAALQSTDIMKIAPEHLRLLSDEVGASANLAVFDVDRMVLLHREQGPHAVTVSARLGSYRPMQASGLGKAYLSAMSPAEREELIAHIDFKPYAPNTITNADDLRREIAAIQAQGYAVDRSEFEQTLACCAAPVFDHRRMPVAAVSVSGLAERILPNIDRLGPMIKATARAISTRLGYPEAA